MELIEPKKRKSRTKNTEAVDERKFICKCGKRYLSYSALYTHSKQKHGMIISTKNIEQLGKEGESLLQQQCEIQESSKQKVLKNLRSFNLAEVQKEKFLTLEKVVSLFLYQNKSCHSESFEYMTDALSRLIEYVNKNFQILQDYKYTSDYSETRSAHFLPLAFNHFIHEYAQKKWENYDPKKLIDFLNQFGSWLFKEQLTKFRVEIVQ